MSQQTTNNTMSGNQTGQVKVESGESITIEQATCQLRKFTAEREWDQFHTPRNLVMALVGEVGEVAEIFQWKGEVSPGVPQFSENQKVHLGQELADVFAYLIRLSDVCKIDLSEAFQRKMVQNGRKYPKEIVKGSSKKYTEYKQIWKEKEKQVGEK